MAYVNMMPAELAEKYTREKLWLQRTVFDILAEQAAAHPDRIAIKDYRGAITYGALKDKIERKELGVKTGKGFYTYPNPEFGRPDFLRG